MDFGTIKVLFLSRIIWIIIFMQIINSFKMIWTCISIILRVFYNCELYNGSESEINKLSISIKKEF